MRVRPRPLLFAACALGAFAPTAPARADDRAPLCSGEYADELSTLSSRVRELERDKANQYSYCLRTIATYECLSYGSDGTVRHARKSAIAHGTAFAYRKSGGETFLLTNDHVASWPTVTDEEHRVDDVPVGCKLVSESTRIVDDEDDGYEANDVALTRVVADPALDVAVLKTREPIRVIPYRVGRSSQLRAGNVVAVRGFPLGAFAALNLGKVVNAYDHDTAHDWDHDDFVVDALLSPGNSGSPVLAISCKTGEYELVGIYHAGYVGGSALNVVVGIDQVRDLMGTLKRSPRVADGAPEVPGAAQRTALRAALVDAKPLPGGATPSFFFPFGQLVATVRVEPGERGAIWYDVYSRGFPLHDERLLVLEDLPRNGAFGEVGRVFLGNRRGLRAFEAGGLDPDAQGQLARVVLRLRTAALQTMRYRVAGDPATATRQSVRRQRAIERVRERGTALDREAAQTLADLADRLGPRPGDKLTRYSEAVAPSP